MNKTKIEWCDYTVNPVKGYCPMACPYCYARRMYDRFGWDKTIRFEPKSRDNVHLAITSGYRVFVGSSIELFGEWVKEEWLKEIFEMVKWNPRHTFIFLTKQPQNLIKWSPFPENCWVGVSATNNNSAEKALHYLYDIEAGKRFISFEPLLDGLNCWDIGTKRIVVCGLPCEWEIIDWLIIGAETGNRKEKPPLTEVHKWAGEIIQAADEAGIPIFLKDNLKWPTVRREWPK